MVKSMLDVNRRGLFSAAAGAATLAGVTLSGIRPSVAQEASAPAAADAANWRRFGLGGFTVTVFRDGMRKGDGPYPIFGANQDAATVEALLAENFLPAKQFVNSFSPTLVQTGSETILFDTGLGAGARPAMGNLGALLAASGVKPEDVTVVAITHMHGDHIGGLMENGAPAFPNARYVASAVEYDHWTKVADAEAGKGVAANVVPLAEKITFVKDGDTVVSGVTVMEAHGHSPGHSIFHLESDGRRLVITADTANHYVVSLQRPDWEVRFDMDKAAAAATRKKVFGMLAADKVPFIGYHMPFPAVGFVEPLGDGFRYVPATYQFDL
jgi:glyoxylase-like metal-dependent hydrolase (beta-lactamase superfamily II)